MHKICFYQKENNSAIRLNLVSKFQYESIALSAAERNIFIAQQFDGGMGQVLSLFTNDGNLGSVYIGIGEASETNISQALAIAATRVPAGCYRVEQNVSEQALLNWSLAQYRFTQYKKNTTAPRILCVPEKLLSNLLIKSKAVFLVRDLINTPPNDMGPAELSTVLKQIAEEHDACFEEWLGDGLLENNYPAIHAVGRAAAASPRLLSLKWGKAEHPKVTLVGKGVCFDSGGLDIKPASGMRLMKKDMGGAAQVIGLAQWIMSKKLPVQLQVLVPAVENAIGSKAYRPGDVLTMRNGLTVEIDNTDAEGRLILADALVKACEEKPEVIFNFATLTGAARVAVGTEISAFFTTNDQLAQDVSESANQVGDPIWRMPLFDNYNSHLDSSIADMTNCGASGYAGAITAALFLKRFIAKDIPWMHLDMMAWNTSSKPGKPEGGEAMGMLAVGEYLVKRYG